MPRMILSLLRRRPCFQAPWGGAVVTPHLWPLRSYLELGALPTAVPCARLHARHLLWEWGLNELASNTRPPGCSTSSLLITGSIGLCAGHPGKRGSWLTAVGYSRVRGKTVCGIREDQGHGDGGA
jgi:hypothetical protein